MPGDSVPHQKKTTTKEKARKKLGQRIFKEKFAKRVKGSKLDRNSAAAAKAQPKTTPVLLRTEEAIASGSKPRRDSGFTDRMDVDEFMEGGFEKAMEEMEGEDGSEEEEDEDEEGRWGQNVIDDESLEK